MRFLATTTPLTRTAASSVAERSHVLSDGIVLTLATTIALPVFAKAFGFRDVPFTVLFAIIWLSGAADRLVSFHAGRYQPSRLTWTGPRPNGVFFLIASILSTMLIAGRQWFPQWPVWSTVGMPSGLRVVGAVLGGGLTLLRLRLRHGDTSDDTTVGWRMTYSAAEPVLLCLSLLLMSGSPIAVVALPWPMLISFVRVPTCSEERASGARDIRTVAPIGRRGWFEASEGSPARAGIGLLGTSISRWITRLDQFCCRHSYIRRFGNGWMWLECVECGYGTPGIQAGEFVKLCPSERSGLTETRHAEPGWAIAMPAARYFVG